MIDLTEYNEMYEDAEVPADDFSPVPDGKYQVIVDTISIEESKKGEPMIKWQFKIISDPQKGRLLWKYSVIKDTTIEYIKGDISVCGLKLKKFSDLQKQQTLQKLLDLKLEVKLITKGENQNIYIQRKIETNDDEKVDADQIPF